MKFSPKSCREKTVQARECKSLLQEYATPGRTCYVKLDIEGAEMPCVRELKTLGRKTPPFVSLELNSDTVDESVSLLVAAGYNRFKVVSQWGHAHNTGGFGELVSDLEFNKKDEDPKKLYAWQDEQGLWKVIGWIRKPRKPGMRPEQQWKGGWYDLHALHRDAL